MLSAASVLALAACGGSSPSGTVSLPLAGDPASVVLDTYLQALVAGDCDTARALVASTFSVGNGELCGEVEVTAFSAPTGPARSGPHVVEYASDLTTGGSSDGSISSGRTTWFYRLARQGGEWRLISGGSGP